MNSLNLRQVCGGDTIKQADFGSELAFELLDEQYVKFREPLGEAAKVILKKDNTAIYQKSVPITQNTVSFKFDKILPVGSYVLEIIVGDYVFPSNNRVIITVEQTYGDFEPEYLVKVSYEELKADVDDVKTKIEQFENTLNANETNVNQELLTIGKNQAEMTKRIETLEQKQDNDTIYDDTNLKSQVSELQEKLKSLNTVRRAPTGYTLDRTTVPWTIWFDNGCGLQLVNQSPKNEREKQSLVYSYGFNAPTTSMTPYAGPIPELIISATRGTFTVDKFKESDEGHFQNYINIVIINPIKNDIEKYDWTNAFGDRVNTNWNSTLKVNFTKLMYQLGIWSDNDVKYLGATLK